jgi:hypothetical protein
MYVVQEVEGGEDVPSRTAWTEFCAAVDWSTSQPPKNSHLACAQYEKLHRALSLNEKLKLQNESVEFLRVER